MKLVFLVVLLLSQQLYAERPFSNPAVEARIARRVRIATDVIEDRMVSHFPIPVTVLDSAQCIASMRVAKAGFIWGGEGSTGMVSCRTQQGWSQPSFLNAGGPSFGFQIGIQFLDSALLFISSYGRKLLEQPSFRFGVDLSVAAGPVGGGTSAGFTPKAHILTYDRAVGLYAGVSLQGFVLAHGPERNGYVYGAGTAPYQILRASGSVAPAIVKPFVDVLEQYSPR